MLHSSALQISEEGSSRPGQHLGREEEGLYFMLYCRASIVDRNARLMGYVDRYRGHLLITRQGSPLVGREMLISEVVFRSGPFSSRLRS